MTPIYSRRKMARKLISGAFASAVVLNARDYGHARDLVARVQDDLQRAAGFSRNNEKERDRYHNVQHKLSEFDRELRDGHFDKDKLDDVIDNLKSVVNNNTLESHDRDVLASDLADLRTMRATRGR